MRDWHREALRLREQGLTYREIGERIGRTTGTVSSTITRLTNAEYREAERARSRAYKDRNRASVRASNLEYRDRRATGRCACGQRISDSGNICGTCKRSAAAERRRERIAGLWAQGLTEAQVAAELGITHGSIRVEMARMRRAGWDLPCRYPANEAKRQAVAA